MNTTETVRALARRCLWIAYCWNDHNFEEAHKYARREAEEHGIKSFEDANALLAQAETAQPASAKCHNCGEDIELRWVHARDDRRCADLANIAYPAKAFANNLTVKD